MKTAAAAATAYTILETRTIRIMPAKRAAELFGAMLGADRGYSSRIISISNRTYDCVASDGRAIRFTQPALRAA